MLDIKRRPVRQIAISFTVVLLAAPPAPANEMTVFSSGHAGWGLLEDADHALWPQLEGYHAVPGPPGEATHDLLAYIRSRFELPYELNRRVQVQLDWFVRNPAYLERVFARARQYMPHIVAEIESRGLPPELALLPIVESAYDPFAYSHGRAAGLWQIVPGTARRFGISQDWWYDGRRDVIDATDGALRYLEYLHELMDGDWWLAIASYNSGEGNVLRAVRKNRANGQPTDFWNLGLPRETRSYVPKLIALIEIVRDPSAFGLTLPTLSRDEQFVAADIGGQLDLALAAELAGIDLDTLYSYNAGFNRWATRPEGPHRLIVPVSAAEGFATALATLPAEERVRWQRHKVGSGETISEIAEQYGTTVSAIRSSNDLAGNTIRAGAYLMIPVASRPLEAYGQSADARRERTQNRQRKGQRVEHVVQPGESFWSLGRRYGVGMRALAGWNGMAPRDTLSVGQTLVVWTDVAPQAARGGATTTRKLRYTVRRGDSLSRIASRFRVTVADLTRWNNIDENNILRPGQTLTMYVDVTRQSS